MKIHIQTENTDPLFLKQVAFMREKMNFSEEESEIVARNRRIKRIFEPLTLKTHNLFQKYVTDPVVPLTDLLIIARDLYENIYGRTNNFFEFEPSYLFSSNKPLEPSKKIPLGWRVISDVPVNRLLHLSSVVEMEIQQRILGKFYFDKEAFKTKRRDPEQITIALSVTNQWVPSNKLENTWRDFEAIRDTTNTINYMPQRLESVFDTVLGRCVVVKGFPYPHKKIPYFMKNSCFH